MQTQQRYTLGANERLKSRKVIEQLFKTGKAFSHFPFRIVYLMEPGAAENKWPLKAGFTVGVKYFKKATDRNRIRRLMKENWRLQKNELNDQLKDNNKTLSVFFIYTGNEIPDHAFIEEKTGTAIKRLLKLANESSTPNT